MDKPVISDYMKKQNELFHVQRKDYGTFSSKWAKGIKKLLNTYYLRSILDYGAGKQALKKDFPFLQSYDPGIPSIAGLPAPADFVICTHVLEHVEPELLDNVISHIYGLTQRAFLITVNSGPSNKILPDGRDSNLIQEDIYWWFDKLCDSFHDFKIYNLDRKSFISGQVKETNVMDKGTFLGIKL